MKTQDIARAEELAKGNRERIIRCWHEHFDR
jgi:hypothetical protein